MHAKQCAMCDKEYKKLSARDWCDSCEIDFNRSMQTLQCANRTHVCETPYSCLIAKKCVQVKAVMITSSQVYETRERLRKCGERNQIGMIAAASKIPEYALRDWVENASHFISQQELIAVIDALDRYVPAQCPVERTPAG